MRFQFWRDALSAIFAGKPAPQHPVALALADMHKARPVQRYYLGQMIEARVSLNARVAKCNRVWSSVERSPVAV